MTKIFQSECILFVRIPQCCCPFRLRTGDLAFINKYPGSDGNHVGICVGFLKNGEPLIAHCSATQNKVVVSTCGSEFKYFRRPCSVLTAN